MSRRRREPIRGNMHRATPDSYVSPAGSIRPSAPSLQGVIAQFAPMFGLRSFRDDVFRINPNTSYMLSGGRAVLQIEVWSRGEWQSFVEATTSELLKKIAPLPTLEGARVMQALNPGSWLRTDDSMTSIIDTRPGSEDHPRTGGRWWRSQDLLRELETRFQHRY